MPRHTAAQSGSVWVLAGGASSAEKGRPGQREKLQPVHAAALRREGRRSGRGETPAGKRS